VIGPKARVAQFANAWRAAAGATPRLEISQRIFAADHVDEPRPTTGAMRDYEPVGDRELAIRWMDEFVAEAMPETPLIRSRAPSSSTAARRTRRRASSSGKTSVPSRWRVFGGRTPNGIRVGPVYTPPDLRGRGYASAVTAALTQRLLDSGRRFCFLYTDLANPTSNSIYQRIGYHAVADSDLWTFTR
jgi:GNAT superfamily N-acetyltransferase